MSEFKGGAAECTLGSPITPHHERSDVIQKIPRLPRRKLLAMTIQSDPKNSFTSFKTGNGIRPSKLTLKDGSMGYITKIGIPIFTGIPKRVQPTPFQLSG